ncbi:LptF/LptG family permease [Candidatus Latescibacterota bacterium]
MTYITRKENAVWQKAARAMNIIHRYIIREHIAPFIFAFAVIMFILILKLMLQLMDMLITSGVGIWVIGQLLLYNLAWMVALVVPMSVLVSSLMAFGRLGASREIIALKAAGISMYRVLSPILLLTVLLTIVMVLFNNEVLPAANHRARSLQMAINIKNPMLSLKNREKQFISDLPGITLRIDRINYDTEELSGVTLFRQEDGDYSTTIVAEQGRFELYPTGDRLALVLEQGEIHRIQPEEHRYIRSSFDVFRQLITINFNLDISRDAPKNDRTKTTTELLSDVQGSRERIANYRSRIASLPSDGAAFMAERNHLERLIEAEEREINKNYIEIYKKDSIPFAAIIFVMIGSALGILVRRSGASIGIGLSIGFFTLYYLFLIAGESAGDRLLINPWLAMWLPNLFFGPVAVALVWYANRR